MVVFKVEPGAGVVILCGSLAIVIVPREMLLLVLMSLSAELVATSVKEPADVPLRVSVITRSTPGGIVLSEQVAWVVPIPVQLPELVRTFSNDSPLGMEITALELKAEACPLFVTDKTEEKGCPKGASCGVVWKPG